MSHSSRHLGEAAKEATASSSTAKASSASARVAEVLGLSVYQTDGVLKRHGVERPYTVADFEDDGTALDRALHE